MKPFHLYRVTGILNSFRGEIANFSNQYIGCKNQLFYLGLTFLCLSTRSDAQSLEQKDFLVSDYLNTVSSKLGCYFTIELADQSGTPPFYLNNRLTNDAKVTSIPKLIVYLRRSLKGVVVEPDSKNAKILHLIEAPLKNDTNYALNKRISLNFSGPLMERGGEDSAQKNGAHPMTLIEAAAAKVKPSILMDEFYASHVSSAIGDTTTTVVVNATNESVRTIFSDCLPLAGYRPFLWEAHVWTVRSKTMVFVQFGGSKR